MKGKCNACGRKTLTENKRLCYGCSPQKKRDHSVRTQQRFDRKRAEQVESHIDHLNRVGHNAY